MISLTRHDIWLNKFSPTEWDNWYEENPPGPNDFNNYDYSDIMLKITVSSFISLTLLFTSFCIHKYEKRNIGSKQFANVCQTVQIAFIILILTLGSYVFYFHFTYQENVCEYDYMCQVHNNTLYPSKAYYIMSSKCPENTQDLVLYYDDYWAEKPNTISESCSNSQFGCCKFNNQCQYSLDHTPSTQGFYNSDLELYTIYIDHDSGYSSYAMYKDDDEGSNCYEAGNLEIINKVQEINNISKTNTILSINIIFYIFITFYILIFACGKSEYQEAPVSLSGSV